VIFGTLRTMPTMNPQAAPSTSRASTSRASTSRASTSRASPRVTHASRIVDKTSGITKGELADYFAKVAPLMLPHLAARPVALVRAPGGISGFKFFQKHADESEMPGVALLDPSLDPGHEPLLKIAGAQGIASAAQMNVIELHTWNMTTRSIPKPDRLIFDLDPGEGVDWSAVREASQLMRTYLDELGVRGFLKTSGGKGLHVVVPIRVQYDWSTVKQFAQAVVVHLATVIPQRFVAKSGPKNRVGKLFIDFLRNGWGATTVCAWSPRARPGLGVSVPIDWEELDSVGGGAHWTVRNAHERFERGNRPWEEYSSTRQTLSKAMKALGFSRDGAAR
jgi:bifunctional non-homologous end joining protein LigD